MRKGEDMEEKQIKERKKGDIQGNRYSEVENASASFEQPPPQSHPDTS